MARRPLLLSLGQIPGGGIAPLGLALLLAAAPARAEQRQNLLEGVEAALAKDAGLSDAQREELLVAIRGRFAGYGTAVIDPARPDGLRVVLQMIAEGEMDELGADRIAEVAFAAFTAVFRGAPAEVVEGIALYGFRKKVDADRIADWANGYRLCTERKVPPEIAADLVRNAMEQGWDGRTFDTVKWALVAGVQQGHEPRLYAARLFVALAKGQGRPGAVSAQVAQEFKRAREEKRTLPMPAYQGSFHLEPPPREVRKEHPPPQEDHRGGTQHGAEQPGEEQPGEEQHGQEQHGQEQHGQEQPVRAPGGGVAALVAAVRSFLGTPYVWGGETHQGIDCSGLTQASYRQIAIELPRVAREQWHSGSQVGRSAPLQTGDLVFFDTLGSGVSHVGLVIDGPAQRFIHASSSHGVMEESLGKRYFQARYLGARRVLR